MTDQPIFTGVEAIQMFFIISATIAIAFGHVHFRIARDLRDTQEQYFQAINFLHHEINRLRGWSFEKSAHYKELTPDQIKVAQTFAAIDVRTRSKSQQAIVDQYHAWMMKTGQTFDDKGPEIILPPDDSGEWRWNDEAQMWDHKSGQKRNEGRRAASSSAA